MTPNRRLFFLYLFNASLLLTHEVDSAFWKEWDLFGLPGGIQFFLVLNFLMIVAAFFGFAEVVKGTRAGLYSSLALAVVGIFAFSIHSYFLLTGHPEFGLPVSLIILAATLLVSAAQAILVIFALRKQ
jgi:hypothetical protein